MFTIIFRTTLFYFIVLILYRIMGKREVGQLSIVDLIISILIAELVAISIENYKDSIMISIIPIVILTLLQVILAYISLKFPKTRSLFDGKPSIIINKGKINFREMGHQKYNLDDLLMQLREQGIKSIDLVDYAILENSGKLSVFKKNILDTSYPLPIIVDGNINKEVLLQLKKDETWLNNLLINKNINRDEIFYAFYKSGKTYIIKKEE